MSAPATTKPRPNTLTERYVQATVRHVPQAQRPDVARELRASIADMVEARAGAGQSPGDAERDALTELGDPERLAATYAGRDLVLIGPRLFLEWWRLLKLLLAIVPAILVVITVIGGVADDHSAGKIVGDAVGAAWNVAINIAFWVTLVFAMIERFAPDEVDEISSKEWTPDELPESADPRGGISFGETAASIGFLAVVIAFFPWQEWRPPSIGGVETPLLNTDLWSFWLPFLIAVLVIEIGYELVKYRIGRWTPGLLAAKAVINLAFAIPVVWLLLAGDFLNPGLTDALDASQSTIDTSASITAVVVIAITIWDFADAAWKARQSQTLA